MTEQGNATSVTETTTENTASVETSAASSTPENATQAQASTPDLKEGKQVGAIDATSPYSPNFKFKVLDQEREFDEWLRPLVKDVESEKRVRDLLERAYGIDAVKSDRAKVREELQTYRSENDQLKQGWNQLSQMVQNRDPNFFKAARIPEEFVLESALSILKEREMKTQSPEQWQALQRQRTLEEQYQEAIQQNQLLQEQTQQAAVQYRNFELQNTLQSPEVSTLSQAFDAKVGPGSFRAEVIRRGQWYWATQGIDKPVQELVNEVGAMAKAFIGSNPGIQGEITAAPTVATPQATPKPNVIPNIEGKGVSPAKKVKSRISELRALQKEMA